MPTIAQNNLKNYYSRIANSSDSQSVLNDSAVVMQAVDADLYAQMNKATPDAKQQMLLAFANAVRSGQQQDAPSVARRVLQAMSTAPAAASPPKTVVNNNMDGESAPAGPSSTGPGQGVSNTAASIGLGLMGVPAIGLTGLAANAIGSAIAGQQADAMGEAANNVAAINAEAQPGVVAVSDPNGNTFSFSSPATIAASDEADFGLDGVTAADSGGDDGDGSSGVGGAGVGAAGGTGTGSAGDGPGWAKGGKVTKDKLVGKDPKGPDDGYGALDDGEYVIKASVVKSLGAAKLRALNEGRADIVVRKK